MPEATKQVLEKLVAEGPIEAYRIEAPLDTADSRYVGVVGVSNFHPTFHVSDGVPFSGRLSADSRFHVVRLEGPGNAGRVFVVFRQFETSPDQVTPEDIVAGWVPTSREADAREWVADMNARIAGFSVVDEATTTSEEPPVDRDSSYRYFNLRTRFQGHPEELVRHLESRLGCVFRAAEGHGSSAAFQVQFDGLSVLLVEFPPVGGYPRRFNLTGNPVRIASSYDGEVDLTGTFQARLSSQDIEWYVPTPEELKIESGL